MMLDQREGRGEQADHAPRPRPARRRPRAWMIYLAVLVPLIVTYRLLPTALTRSLMYDAIALSCLAAILIGVRINRPDQPLPWLLLASGVGCWVVGDLIWTYLGHVLHTAPFPSAADVMYLVAYAFFISGMYLMVRRRVPKGDRSLLIDGAIVTIAAGVIAWMFLIDPYAHDHSLTLAQKLFSTVYPVADVLLLSILVRGLLGTRARSTANVLLGCGLMLSITSDSVYGLLMLEGTYTTDHIVRFGWLLFYALWGTAGLHPSMGGRSFVPATTGPPKVATPSRLWVMGVVALLLPALAFFQPADEHSSHQMMSKGGSMAIFLLVIWRMGGLLTRLEAAHGTLRRLEREKGKLLDRTMQVGEEERVRLATQLHDGPIHQLSAVAYRFEAALLQLQRGDHDSAALALAKVRDSFGHEINTLREMMQGLRPPELDERGLNTAMRDQLSGFRESSGIHGTLEISGENRLPREIETAFFRITQEALANVARHSGGRRVRLELHHGERGTQLTIEDDGIGFDTTHIASDLASGQFGLIAMRQHVEALGGRFEVTSSNAGTVLRARFGTRAA